MHSATNKIPDRFIWAAEMLELKPGFKVLEIGCGTGILSDLISAQLVKGNVLAIDRSRAMIEKAVKRHALSSAKNIPGFSCADLSAIKLPQNHFDRIVAFNVNLFWKKSGAEFEKIKTSLNKKGMLYVFHQAPYEIGLKDIDPLKKNLVKHGFKILELKLKKLQPTSAVCIKAVSV